MTNKIAAGQVWNPDSYAQNARFVANLGVAVVTLLEPKPGERILDLGCGDGALTKIIIAYGCKVLGVDGSPAFIDAARQQGVPFDVMDGQALTFDSKFDAVFSNAALHWMKDVDAVIAGVHRSLKPGGRFVAEMGGDGNVAAIVNALSNGLRKRGIDPIPLNPWYFPTAEDYRRRLNQAGFIVDVLDLFPRPTPLPGDVIGWLTTFAQNFTNALPEKERTPFLQEVCDALEPVMKGADGWTADYVRLRFKASKKAN